MNPLSPAAQALIDAARRADDPTPQARARGDAAVRVALAMHGVTDVPRLDASGSGAGAGASAGGGVSAGAGALAGAGAHAGGGAGALGLKIGVGAAVVVAGVLALRGVPREGERYKDGGGAPVAVAAPIAKVAGSGEQAVQEVAGEAVFADARPSVPRSAGERRRAVHGRRAGALEASHGIVAEVRLISSANGLVRDGRFDEALRVLARHAQRFPDGALREERGALRVLSLCADAPDAHARREGERFLRSAPRSVLAARVRAACAQ